MHSQRKRNNLKYVKHKNFKETNYEIDKHAIVHDAEEISRAKWLRAIESQLLELSCSDCDK